MKNIILILAVLLLTATLGGCLVDSSLKLESTAVPQHLDDGWAVSTPSAENMDEAILQEAYRLFYDDDHYYNALALLVVRNGKILFETYTRSIEDRKRLHHVQSVTKSITSLLFGIIRAEGYFPDLDTTMASFIPEKFSDFPEKRAITLRHLLTMRSGIAFDNEDFSAELRVKQPSDPVSYILAKPMIADPGKKFYYRDCDPHLLSALVRSVTEKTIESWAVECFFPNIGITRYHWLKDPAGTTTGAYGLYLTPRDLARLGQLVLQRGSWNGTTVVSEEWIVESTSPQTESGWTEYSYGYYWWIIPELDAVTAWGHGGNFIFVDALRDLVIVMVSLPDVDDGSVGTTLPEFAPLARLIIEACN